MLFVPWALSGFCLPSSSVIMGENALKFTTCCSCPQSGTQTTASGTSAPPVVRREQPFVSPAPSSSASVSSISTGGADQGADLAFEAMLMESFEPQSSPAVRGAAQLMSTFNFLRHEEAEEIVLTYSQG